MYSKIILIFSITELIEFYLKFIESLFNDFCRKFGKLIIIKILSDKNPFSENFIYFCSVEIQINGTAAKIYFRVYVTRCPISASTETKLM